MKKLRSGARLIGLYFRNNLAAALEYRMSFLTSAFGMAVSNGTFVFFWWVAFEQVGGRIGGSDFRDVMFIWAASSAAYGVANVFFGNMNQISRLIVTGELDTYLLQPGNTLLNLLCANSEFTAWGDLAYGVLLMALTGQGAAGWACFLLALPCGALLLIAMALYVQSLAFFIGNASGLASLSLNFSINLCLYPEGIFPRAVRAFLYTVVPAGYMVHVPLKLARGGTLWWLPLEILFPIAFFAGACRVFYQGLKRYESGNLIVTRV